RLEDLRADAGPLAVVVCPSNPYLSIDPILALPGLSDFIRRLAAPVIAVSPIVGGDAVKGPAAKIMRELGHAPSALTVARHYRGLIDGFVFDTLDAKEAGEIAALGLAARTTDT